jgi:hypothetical protein
MYGGQEKTLLIVSIYDLSRAPKKAQNQCTSQMTSLKPAMAPIAPSFLDAKTPSLIPLAQKFFDMPYMTWTRLESMMLSRPRERIDVNGIASGADRFSKTEWAYISSLIRWSL